MKSNFQHIKFELADILLNKDPYSMPLTVSIYVYKEIQQEPPMPQFLIFHITFYKLNTHEISQYKSKRYILVFKKVLHMIQQGTNRTILIMINKLFYYNKIPPTCENYIINNSFVTFTAIS